MMVPTQKRQPDASSAGEPSTILSPARDISLLWPQPSAARGTTLDPNSLRDLALGNTINALTLASEYRSIVERVMLGLCMDREVLLYRQDILADLLGHPQLVAQIRSLLRTLDTLTYSAFRVVKDSTLLHEVTWRVSELQGIIDGVQGLSAALRGAGDGLRSAGLLAARAALFEIEANPTFQNLVKELPDLIAGLRTSASVTIGVNLDHNLNPVEAVLVSVNEQKFSNASLLNRLFGKGTGEWQGIAPLHGIRSAADGFTPDGRQEINPLMVPLFKDLAMVLEKVCQPIAQALQRYVAINSGLLVDLRNDLVFYLGAVRLIRHIEACGLPMCRPQLAGADERVCEVADGYNLNLALHLAGDQEPRDLRDVVVKNDFILGERGRIVVLTGPNQGGKTTYIQAIGLLQALAQAGLWVPGTHARVSPVDAIYTHYPIEEQLERGTGRFGDEAQRLGEIFKQVTRHSLLLLNESLSSTSAGESLYLAQDLMRILRLIGVRAVYSTHLHDLAAAVEALNAGTAGDSLIISMVASPMPEAPAVPADADAPVRRSYRVVAGPPMGDSHAREIAAHYGISFDQLQETLRARGVLDPDTTS